MTKVTWKPGTLLAPVPPAMISCGTVEKPNVMTAAWTGIIASEPPMTYVSIRPSRYSHEIISETKEFVINLTNLPLVAAADFCGVKSGRDLDKFKEMNLTALPCSEVKAPQIAESPVSIECKVKDVQHFGTHDMFLAEIVAVNIDDQYLDEDGRLALEKSGLVAYVHGHYYTLGRNLGNFGFSVNKVRLKQMQKMAEVKVEVKPAKKAVIDDSSDKFEKESRERRPMRDGDGERRSRPARSEGGFDRNRSDDRRRPMRDGDGERRSRPARSEGGFDRNRSEDRRRPMRDGDGERRSRPARSEGGFDRNRSDDRRRPMRDGDGERRSRPARSEGGFDRNRSDDRRRPMRDGDGERRSRPARSEGGFDRNRSDDRRRAPRSEGFRSSRQDGEGSASGSEDRAKKKYGNNKKIVRTKHTSE